MSTAERLTAYLATWTGEGFDWRLRHCGTFAAGWVREVTGRDALAGLESHRTLADWRRAVGGDMAELVSRQLQSLPVLSALAQLGDVVLLPGRITGGTLAICAGRTAATIDELGACIHVPMIEARCAWRVMQPRDPEQTWSSAT